MGSFGLGGEGYGYGNNYVKILIIVYSLSNDRVINRCSPSG